MSSENIFEDSEATMIIQQRVKMHYLQNQKQRLEIAVSELLQNNSLLRRVNQQIVKSAKQKVDASLNIQNIHLQQAYQRLLVQNNKITAQMFLFKQITAQQQIENREAIRQYQDRILQLRRAIQSKQGFVQSLESNVKYHHNPPTSTVPPHNVSMLFYHQIEQYKDIINRLRKQNTSLYKQNQKMKKQIELKTQKLRLIDNLTSSNVTFYEFKQLMKFSQRSLSQPRKQPNNFINQDQKDKNKKLKQKQVQNDQNYQPKFESSAKINQVSMLLMKKNIQNQQICKQRYQLSQKIINQQILIQKLQQSNKIHQETKKQTTQQLNYYKKCTQQFLKILTTRRPTNKSKSLERNYVQKMIQSIKKPKQITYVADRRHLWQHFKEKIKIPQFLQKVKRRPLSSAGDYVRIQEDDVDKYLAKKRNQIPKPDTPNLANFSVMLDQYASNQDKDPFDFSIIKPGQRMSYAQMKDMKKNKKNIQKQGLTLIQQDII